MAFNPKSKKQANFLHSLAGDQAKGGVPPISKTLAPPMTGGVKPLMPTTPGPNPMVNPAPVAMTHIPQAPAPKFMPPRMPASNPAIAAPGLPGMNKLPKFGKMRNSLKGGPFKKQ